MTTKPLLVGLLAAALLLGACEQHEAARTFDPKFIAQEADRGNLEPLKQLNEACRSEALKHGKRLAACATQDEVRSLAKPLRIEF
jgi:hypothetical protein